MIQLLASYPDRKRFFYSMRDIEVDKRSDAEVAAWFIYMNKTGYNGLYRGALAAKELVVANFEVVAARVKRGDFVYFDPPYVPLSATSSFTSYTSQAFTLP